MVLAILQLRQKELRIAPRDIDEVARREGAIGERTKVGDVAEPLQLV